MNATLPTPPPDPMERLRESIGNLDAYVHEWTHNRDHDDPTIRRSARLAVLDALELTHLIIIDAHRLADRLTFDMKQALDGPDDARRYGTAWERHDDIEEQP